jgi:hypothetical protein
MRSRYSRKNRLTWIAGKDFPGSCWFGCITALFFIITSSAVLAQAWLPPKGEGSIELSVQTNFFDGHYDDSGNKARGCPTCSVGVGQSRASSLILGVNYSFTDRFNVEISLPYVFTRYTGNPADLTFGNPAFHLAPLDDGATHSTFQDFRLDLRYNVLSHSHRSGLQDLAITPFVSLTQPSHSYDYHGESAFGRDLREGAFGITAGRLLTPLLPRTFAQAQYSYALVEKASGFGLNHSNVDLELGYFLPHDASVFAFGNWLHTYGGVTLNEVLSTPALFPVHDRILRATYWHLGGGASYPLTRTIDINFSYVSYLAGESTHYGKSFTIGTAWNFTTRSRRASSREADAAGDH